ncbi:MAG: ABC transporter permease [Deltaproteobacteria bacterium]|nr:ABC transporter permease [Deltaproteobacteria bacterium]
MQRTFRPGLAVAAVALALVLAFAALPFFGKDPFEALVAMVRGGVGSPTAIGESLVKAAILTLAALAVALPFTTGLFNIGGQGQLLWGAIAAAFLGRALSLPAVLELPICLLGAALAGGLWGLLAGWLKTARGVHEVISTILLNWIALHLIENGLVVGPLAAKSADASVSLPGTAQIHPMAQLPVLLAGTRLHLGVPLAFAVAMALAWAMARTTWGFELRAVGSSPEASRSAGIPVAKRQLQAMALGAACAGLGGALLVLGTEGRYPPHVSSPYGFDGIALAFIGGNGPIGSAIAALFFGAIRAGGTRLQLLGVHRDFPEVIQGLALLLVAGRALLAWAANKVRPTRAVEVHRA